MLGVTYIPEPKDCVSNYWLNVILFNDREARNGFLQQSNTSKVMTRPAWTLMNKLAMFSKAISGNLETSEEIEACLVNIPSSVRK